MWHSFNPFQFYMQKILYPRYSSPVACTSKKVIRHMTSDFDMWSWPGHSNELSKHCVIKSIDVPRSHTHSTLTHTTSTHTNTVYKHGTHNIHTYSTHTRTHTEYTHSTQTRTHRVHIQYSHTRTHRVHTHRTHTHCTTHTQSKHTQRDKFVQCIYPVSYGFNQKGGEFGIIYTYVHNGENGYTALCQEGHGINNRDL